jgi:hypothetical protein
LNSCLPDGNSSASETRHKSGHHVTAHAGVGFAKVRNHIVDKLNKIRV